MNSKEVLKNICSKCEEEKWKNKIRCPFRSISSDYCEEYETIEKDLEVLEILKEHVAINKCIYDDTKMIKCIEIVILEGDINYSKIKEWLEDESHWN